MSPRRWFVVGLTAFMFLFILNLFRASRASAKEVRAQLEEGLPLVVKPPEWESFSFLGRYYGGLRSLVDKSANKPEYPGGDEKAFPDIFKEKTNFTDPENQRSSRVFDPYPPYKSYEYVLKHGRKVDCYLDAAGKVQVPAVHMYEGVPFGMPEAVMGSAELLGMRSDVCFDRFGRLGPYGLGYGLGKGGSGASINGDRVGADDVWNEIPEVDWRGLKWAEVQERCVKANAHRFEPLPPPRTDWFRTFQIGSDSNVKSDEKLSKRDDLSTEPVEKEPADVEKGEQTTKSMDKKPANTETDEKATESIEKKPETSKVAMEDTEPVAEESKPVESETISEGKEKLPRTAVIIRTWGDYPYTPESIMYLRALISELTLQSGGEYHVHFLIQIKDENLPIWSDDETYKRVLEDVLPEEFRGMGTLWTERQMFLMYGALQETWMRDLPVHGVYRSTFMPVQYFAYQHPEYDFFWQWEMDARYTGHWYNLFDSVSKWAKEQPRKNLWERNSRFYVPSKHGSWEDFRHTVRVQTEMGTDNPNNMWAGLKGAGKDGQIRGERPVWGPEPILDNNVTWELDVNPTTSYNEDQYEWGVGEEADLITFNPLFDPDSTTWLLAEDVTGYNTTRSLPPRRVAIITASRLSRRLLLTMHHETSINHHTMFSEMWPASCALHHGFKAVYAPHAEYIDRRWPTDYLESIFNGGKNGASGGSRTSVFGDREHNFRGTTWYYNAGFPEVLWHRWLGYKFNNDGGEEWEISGEGRMCLPAMLLHPIKRVNMVQEGRQEGGWNGGGWNE